MRIKIDSFADSKLILNGAFNNKLCVGGKFVYECYDKDGKLKWREESHNVVTDQGIIYLLTEVFGTQAKVNNWFIGLYTALVGLPKNLTGADIGGANLTEFTSYSGNRKLYSGIRSGGTWTNASTPAEFSITTNATIKGAFLASDDVGTADWLLCIDAFSSGDRAVAPSDVLKVTYNFSMQSI